jgi:hypothetical protein
MGTLVFLSVARKKKSVGQKMDAFSVRTEIHFCEIKRGVFRTKPTTGWRLRILSVLVGSLFAAGMEMVQERLNGQSSRALCWRNLSSLAWFGEGSEFVWRRWV